MSDIAIQCDGISKQYRIGERESYKALRDVITDAIKTPFRRLRRSASAPDSNGNGKPTIWALQDVSFEVKQGDVVGIIGRNGAGKSTLLKILSRITEPTRGRAEINGRVGSLLEVGTGFHPELTGRENIFLNGAILGMKKAEIARKFDEIVAFAEVEKFIDTPIKHYSSGMYLRLAFAVAAHLQTEILIVDEVLAVGDAEFQKKCLGKMQDVSKSGRTVLFVSHSMLAIQRLCETGIYLERGHCKAIGSVSEIIENYVLKDTSVSYVAPPSSSNETRVLSVKILTESPRTDQDLEVEIKWFLGEAIPGAGIGIEFNSSDGQRVFDSTPSDVKLSSPNTSGFHRAVFKVPSNTFLARTYTIAVSLWSHGILHDYQNPALRFTVEPSPTGPYSEFDHREGLVQSRGTWDALQ